MFSAFIVKLHIQGTEQKYFWIWNKITLCCAAYTYIFKISHSQKKKNEGTILSMQCADA